MTTSRKREHTYKLITLHIKSDEDELCKGYGTEEVIEFCVDFIPDLDSIGVPESRHEGD